MKRMKPSDMFAKTGYVRPDGLHVHDMYLVRIKPRSEAKELWDFYDILATIPGEEAFGTPDSTECPFVKNAAANNK
jgi:branched-chain amino acid transport system substrate-binding protein